MKLKLNDEPTKSIILFSLVTIATAIFTIFLFTIPGGPVKYSEKNTYEVRGIVTDFEYVPPIYFGEKIRHPHIIHLDNGTDCVFNYYNYEMYYNDPDQSKIKNELEGQYVVIRLSKINDRVITINTDEKCYLSFEASNRQHIIGIIGVVLLDFSVLFSAYVFWINPIISIKKWKKKKRIKKK